MIEEKSNLKHRAVKLDVSRQFVSQGQIGPKNQPEQQAEVFTPPFVAQPQQRRSAINHVQWQGHPQAQRYNAYAPVIVDQVSANPLLAPMPGPMPVDGKRQQEQSQAPGGPMAAPDSGHVASPGLFHMLFGSRRRTPAFTQMAATECGAACLAMLLTYYGYQTSVSEVSTVCGVGRDGLTAKSILKAARRYGLQASAAAF